MTDSTRITDAPGHSTGEAGQGSPRRRDTILRYTTSDRTNHWLTAIAFVCAGLSGLAMFHPAVFWLSGLFGGGPWTRILHPYIGLFMVVAFALLAVRFWSHNFLQPADWKWLRQIRDVVNNREDRLPEVGRYNAGQKLLYWVIVVCLAGLLLTGIVIWRAYFSDYFSIRVVRLAALLHAFCAFVLITSIIVHIYSAIWVKGSVHAMTRGTVTPGWAWKHHRAWFREMIHAANSRSRPD
ncbi:MAG: Formate dehydrogenase gamma subunit [Gammaproteobacteria bacterium]|nr:Formate dehydrogenase gamma subunit [Gammaproteobacteria bacterium]HEV7444133.1 formate dehydrogenase subunit gamma [Steroidobacteraceae bacterium]